MLSADTNHRVTRLSEGPRSNTPSPSIHGSSLFLLGLVAGIIAYPTWIDTMSRDMAAEFEADDPSCPDGYSRIIAGYSYAPGGYKAQYRCTPGIPEESGEVFADRAGRWS